MINDNFTDDELYKQSAEFMRSTILKLSHIISKKWMPIETAPRPPMTANTDERYILAYCPDEHPHERVRVIWWEPNLRNAQGWRGRWQDDRDNLPAFAPRPTRWIPLPPGPND